ncbi:NAD(P)/FAD-dependent oxidoreductase [Rhodococcus electrodiphilus]|uniref:Phenylacetone monooxygenase n=2 Tax=Nocardiaceae TaxID=85025 RepID=A0A098BG49_9NOCA|nr:NAD(P)/FAD-dependent oxidoreductase [Rhodococcus ruber]MDO2377656.1 NAD(P)/FAD-dependent oxidoreductase [Rhodococcus ruber]CDZ87200.1 Phenylacetone monooxygenase [Rhodococcus ruber]
MSMQTETHRDAPPVRSTDFDAVVVGAGFSGLRMLQELRGLGMSARVIEAGSDVGGTWYWNRYPGARTDSQSWVYAYSFSEELQQDWRWRERYPTQPETLSYFEHVADRFDMRRDIEFDTKVESAVFDDASTTWTVTTDRGQSYTCRYFITATGPLSQPYLPDFDGLADFEGQWLLTGRWPKEGVDFAGKRVAVVGTGATAVQIIPLVAREAAQLTVFQRTPSWALPARNDILTDFEDRAIKANYDAIWEQARQHFYGFPMDLAGRTGSDVTPEEQQRILERAWEIGGFGFLFETFDDILVNDETNKIVSDFVRNKIRTVVEDPATAELLCPKDHPIGSKRPPLGHYYYETYNRDNVRLVDVSTTPISRITPKGIRVGDDEYEADIIIFATGFDAVTGTLNQIDIRGRDGVELRSKWEHGPRTHLGIGVDGFPNMFMVCGPQTPFANIPVVAEGIVEWIGTALQHMHDNGIERMEAEPDAVEQWRKHLDDIVNATVLVRAERIWWLGDNIPGKPHAVLFYFAGAGAYRQECQACIDEGFEGFTLTKTS